jgi:soluble lytic murein transglycosylase-like protein
MKAVEQLVAASYETATTYRLDPHLLLAVISIESGFNPLAESNMGAVGLMQIMPKAHADKLKAFGGEKLALDPWVNMQVGAQILREYLDRFGSETAALRLMWGLLSSRPNIRAGSCRPASGFRPQPWAASWPSPKNRYNV